MNSVASLLLEHMLTVIYRGRPIVHITGGHAHLTAAIAALEGDHPMRRWAMCLGYFALSVSDGTIRNAYTHARAEHFARCALIPEATFLAVQAYGDAVLAEHFGVPLEQIDERRRDLAALRARPAGPPER